MKVLIIDNDPDIADAIQTALHLRGHQTVVAHGGRDGLRQYTRALLIIERAADDELSPVPFDVVVVDIAMPDLDGYSVMQTIRQIETHSPPTPRSRIIAITAFPEIGRDTSVLERCKVDHFLTKPFSITALTDAVESSSSHDDTTPTAR